MAVNDEYGAVPYNGMPVVAPDIAQVAGGTLSTFNDKVRSLKSLNIIVAGKTGVGKSTLINSVFREDFASTGVGKPVTEHIQKYTKKGMPLAIYDTRGFELSRENLKQAQQEIEEAIEEGAYSNDLSDKIHCLWYCINASAGRVEQAEIDWLKSITGEITMTQVPVIIVLTQAMDETQARSIKSVLQNENLHVVQIVPVLAQDRVLNISGQHIVQKSFGLDVLIQVMAELLPDELQSTLQNVQKASLKLKQKKANEIVSAAASAAAITGASPIPFSDCAVLIPAQITMLASITAVYGIKVEENLLKTLISATIGVGGATVLGRTAVSTILKFIPGVGTVVGGAISAVTAAMITGALGEVYIKIMDSVCRGEMEISKLSSPAGRDEMLELFKQELSKK